MRILLINPKFPPSLWDFGFCRDLDGGRYPHAPLALPTLAALTPEKHQVTLVDENVTAIPYEADVDLVGITGYHIQRDQVLAIAGAFRARGRTVVICGPVVERSVLAELAPAAAALFLGEAEYTWPKFLKDLEQGTALPVYAQEELVDMKDSPPPRFDLLARGAYASATIETSRGCPMACEFCEIPTRLGRGSRVKTVPQIMAEVRSQHALGADSIFFIDDNFVGNRAHSKDLLRELGAFVRSIGYSLYFTCQVTINVGQDEELLELLYQANFRRVFVGIETPRRESLVAIRKFQNTAGDLADLVRRIQSHNITVWAGMIVGFDDDSDTVFAEHVDFIATAAIPVTMSGLLQAIPGTPLHDRLARADRLREMDMAGVRGTYEALITSNIRPLRVTDRWLAQGYQKMVRDLYEPEAFRLRLVRSIRQGRRPFHPGGGMTVAKLRQLGRIVRYFLASGEDGRRALFLRTLRDVLFTRPAGLESALLHLVVYKHLRSFYGIVAGLPVPEVPCGSGAIE